MVANDQGADFPTVLIKLALGRILERSTPRFDVTGQFEANTEYTVIRIVVKSNWSLSRGDIVRQAPSGVFYQFRGNGLKPRGRPCDCCLAGIARQRDLSLYIA
jgi:hypothetical protein